MPARPASSRRASRPPCWRCRTGPPTSSRPGRAPPSPSATTICIRAGRSRRGCAAIATRWRAATGARFSLAFAGTHDVFLTEPGPLAEAARSAVEAVTGRAPALSTAGGASDASFIRKHCPVIELGLTNATAHQVDERVPVADLATLTAIYRRFIESLFRDRCRTVSSTPVIPEPSRRRGYPDLLDESDSRGPGSKRCSRAARIASAGMTGGERSDPEGRHRWSGCYGVGPGGSDTEEGPCLSRACCRSSPPRIGPFASARSGPASSAPCSSPRCA